MSMTKKIGLLASMAIIVVAFAVPSFASATLSNWKDKGEAINNTAKIPGSGNASFTGSLGGVTCSEITGELELTVGSTGHVTKFAPVLASCKGTGALKNCTITSITVENLPWTLHDTTTLATVTGVKITNKFSGFLCPGTIVISGNGATLTPDSTTAIKSLALGGELEASVGGNVTVGGSFVPSNESDLGTYGL